MKLIERIYLAEKAGLIRNVDKNFKQRAYTAYKKNLRDPGDCRGDDELLQSLAIAMADIMVGPGWLPEVQRLGCKIAELKGE